MDDIENLKGDDLSEFIKRISGIDGVGTIEPDVVCCLGVMSFYPGYRLYKAIYIQDDAVPDKYFLLGINRDDVFYLNGSYEPFFDLNVAGEAEITDDTVSDYLRFYLKHIRGRHGYFYLIESEDDVFCDPDLEDIDESLEPSRNLIKKDIKPLKLCDVQENSYVFEAFILFKNALFLSNIDIYKDGYVDFNNQNTLIDGYSLSSEGDENTENRIMVKESFNMPAIKGNWTRVAIRALPDLADLIPHMKSGDIKSDNDITVFSMPLPFFSDAKLIRVDIKGQSDSFGQYALWHKEALYPLRGESEVIHQACEWDGFKLDDKNVIEYLKFFCMFVHGDKGPFMVIESLDDMNVTIKPKEGTVAERNNNNLWSYNELNLARLNELIVPARLIGKSDDQWVITAIIQFGDVLFEAYFEVVGTGEVEMINDNVLVEDIPINSMLFHIPDLNHREIDVAIHREFIKEQLLGSLRDPVDSLLYRVDKDLADDEVLKDFAEFICQAHPCIAVESNHVNCEESIKRILEEYFPKKLKVTVASDNAMDSSACVPDIEDNGLLLLSMHKYTSITREEWVVYKLGVTDSAVIVGCPSLDSLPSSLRNLVDIKIKLQVPDAAFVKNLFQRLTGYSWPEAVAIDDESWPRYLIPSDLRQLYSLRPMIKREIPADRDNASWSSRILAMQLYKKIHSRLQSVTDENTPDFSDLHGLGEAKIIAQDLIEDINAARLGDIEWSEIDRGMLIAGAPGTGKTLLARVIARECGINFISATSAAWMSKGDHMGDYISRIRETFADARQMSPCILFIDEIDSIGSRENFSDHNRQYDTMVVNAVLQEIQGINSDWPIFVIAATNYAHNIDPALRRAGRLEQVINIPLPDRKALAAIFKQYLQEYVEQDNVADDMDYAMLAAIAAGSTGADIERFVRNAARRARKDDCTIELRHLVAAVTGRSRTDASLEALCKEEIQRTAVHEAGHAIAIMLCEESPVELAMVSAVPRDDGSLGVTRTALRENQVFTRKAYFEYLEILLAGRAAEELWYGRDKVSSGAGGSCHSDLAKATQVAFDIICRLGMVSSKYLRWMTDVDTDDRLNKVEYIIDESYSNILRKLGLQRPLLNKLQDKLLEDLEITAIDLDQLAEQYKVTGVE